MSASRVAARYGEALFELARDRRAVQRLREELASLVALVASSPELRRALERPDLPTERKMAALERALGATFSQEIVSALAVLVEHGRGEVVREVAEAYGELADRAAGVVRAEAATVRPLTEIQRRRLVSALERLTGQEVRLEERLDPGLLAGVQLRVGDQLIDGSAAGRLARLGAELMSVAKVAERED